MSVEEKNINKDINKDIITLFSLSFHNFRNETAHKNIYLSTIEKSLLLNWDRVKHDEKFVLQIKTMFHKYIVDYREFELVPIYKKLFDDGLYDEFHANIISKQEVIKEIDFDKLTNSYHERIEKFRRDMTAQQPKPKFSVGQIIKLKDRYGKWQMGEILQTHSQNNHHVYYVRYFGYTEHLNEWVMENINIKRLDIEHAVKLTYIWRRYGTDTKQATADLIED